MSKAFDDEELMAFADGALNEPRFSEIATAIEADPDLARRLEELVVGGKAARALYGPLADRPVPARLRSAVTTAIAAAERRARPARVAWQIAAAAVLAAVIAGPLGYLLAGNPAETPLVAVGRPLAPALAAEIEALPSGGEGRLDGTIVRPIATFVDASQALCREFELDSAVTTVAVACRDGAEWRVAIAIDAPPAGNDYAPASSLAALDAYLDSVGAGPPLPPDEEREALANP
jgi:hypothetical protein